MSTPVLSILIKPASSLCNMRCKYCFYYNVSQNREIGSYGIMSQEVMKNLIDRAFDEIAAGGKLYFAFQGGEPTLAGIEYFRGFVSYVSHKVNIEKACSINYSIQTNGLVVDEEWCKFLKENDFLVGLSLDCNNEIHDMHRIDSNGCGTHAEVIKAVKLMDRHKVQYNVLSVVTRAMARKPEKVFKEYLKNRYKYLQFIPCLKPFGESESSSFDLTPQMYAEFLTVFFKQWKHQLEVGNYISIRLFDNLISVLKGYPAEQCGFSGRCSMQYVIEADGSIYPCDFYVLDEYNCGNVQEATLGEAAASQAATKFLGVDQKAEMCNVCRFKALCGGGCRRYRELYHGENSYCAYRQFLYNIYDDMMEVAQKLS